MRIIKWIIRLPFLIIWGLVCCPSVIIGWAFGGCEWKDIKETFWYKALKP